MVTTETKSTTTTQALQAKDENTNTPFFDKDGGNSVLTNDSKESHFFDNNSSNSNKKTPFFSKPFIQTKLTIGQPGDKYEQEADAMADQVVQSLAENKDSKEQPVLKDSKGIQRKPIFESEAEPNIQAKLLIGQSLNPTMIQPKCGECEQEEQLQKKEEAGEEEELQMKPIFESATTPPDDDTVRRACAECAAEEEKLQAQAEGTEAPAASPSLESRLHSSKGSGSPLPENTRTQMEGSFGTDLSGVRVHTDSSAVKMNKELGAQAFAHGNDIYFNFGKYDTKSKVGQRLLSHELTHTLQQRGGIKHKLIQRIEANDQPSVIDGDDYSVPDGTSVEERHETQCPKLVPPYPTESTGQKEESQSVYEELVSIAISNGLLGRFSGLLSFSYRFVWQQLPTSIKVTAINFLLDRAIQGAYLSKIIGRNLPIGSFLSSVLSSALIGFYRQLRKLPDEQKIRTVDRLGLIIVGGDLKFTLNFVKGIVMGFFLDGFVGIIQMVIDIICFLPKIINFFSSLTDFIKNIPSELEALSNSLDELMESLSTFLSNGIQEVYDFIKNPGQVVNFIETISRSIEVGAEKMGEKAAQSMIRYYNLPSAALGEITGRISGQVLFEALLIYFTAGSGAALTFGKIALRYIGRLLNQIGKFIFQIIRFLGNILRTVKEGLIAAVRFLTPAFRQISMKVGNVIDKILDIFRAFRRLCRPGSVFCVPSHLASVVRNIIRASRNRYYLTLGNSGTGWVHILERHVVGSISGKTMFPRGMSHGIIKDLIIEAVELGRVVKTQGERSRILYNLGRGRHGVREVEVWVNNTTRIIETAYPTRGTGVWVFN